MAFGFGFNKAKVLASAEKNVKQGKLQNAIADYEKIVREDPKDLTVLNTMGDLYVRVGNGGQAAECFKRVGDAYAGDGFTVKAIAMYKKLTKVNPHATDVLVRLAELYTQQGLYNDARYQYTQVADSYLRNHDLKGATAVLQKILDLDPENATIQARLADLYVRIDKKTEARDLYFRSAQALRLRGSIQACDESLARALHLDPNFTEAVLLRAEVRMELGDAEAAIHLLDPLPDVDSRRDALQVLLRANLKLGRTAEAEPLARKLLSVFHDVSGVKAHAEALIASGDYDAALRSFREHAASLLAADAAALVETLHALIGRVKSSAASLEILCELFRNAGNTTHLAEVTELLAHAYVQQGDLAKACQLYFDLAEMEPENPLHKQNYRQIVARLGQDPMVRDLSPEEGNQAFLVEELEQAAPAFEQNYDVDLLAAIKAALTEAELFSSYNLPTRAIAPLEAVLPRAPQDVQVNQRLAALYVRVDRFADAAARCDVLQAIHVEAEREKEARQYGELAEKYRQRGATHAQPSPAERPRIEAAQETQPAAAPVVASAAPQVKEPEFEVLEPESAAAVDNELPAATAVEGPQPEPPVHEIDLSEEWERALEDGRPAEAPAPSAPPAASEAAPVTTGAAVRGGVSVLDFSAEPPQKPNTESRPDEANLSDTLEEARFYIARGMRNEARAALARAESIAPGSSDCAALRAELKPQTTSSPAADAAPQPVTEVLATKPLAPATQPLEMPVPPSAAPEEFVFNDNEIGGFESVPQPVSTGARAAAVHPFEQPLEVEVPAAIAVSAGAQSVPHEMLLEVEIAQPAVRQSAASVAGAPPHPDINVSDATPEWVLGDIFDEFKQDLETNNGESQDTETRYNMGVAFKDMGLLDEAIGEFQKVSQSVDAGHLFGQTLETYTWLADCFLQKGVPEAAIRWYEKALAVPGIGSDHAVAINYELAGALEAAGNRPAALRHLLEVYGANIDYRDVAERIKALKS